jgi:hypothetical protein
MIINCVEEHNVFQGHKHLNVWRRVYHPDRNAPQYNSITNNSNINGIIFEPQSSISREDMVSWYRIQFDVSGVMTATIAISKKESSSITASDLLKAIYAVLDLFERDNILYCFQDYFVLDSKSKLILRVETSGQDSLHIIFDLSPCAYEIEVSNRNELISRIYEINLRSLKVDYYSKLLTNDFLRNNGFTGYEDQLNSILVQGLFQSHLLMPK